MADDKSLWFDEGDKNRFKFQGNFNLLIMASSGFGKSLFGEGVIEKLYKSGCTVICLSDMKNKWETCFLGFEPKAKYHLLHLNKQGKKPEGLPIKIYHPFSFLIPKKQLPKLNLFTIPITSLGENELSFLFETKSESNNIMLVSENLLKLKKNQGVHTLMQNLTDELIAEESMSKVIKPKNDELRIPVGQAGNKTNLEEIKSALLPFTRHYMLAPEDCPLNLDMVEVLNDNKHIHCFVTPFMNLKEGSNPVPDNKRKYFAIVSVLSRIINTLASSGRKLKHPVAIYWEEINNMFPADAKDYQDLFSGQVLADLFKLRGMGRGCSIVATAQSIQACNKDIEKGFVEKCVGKVGSIQELGSLGKNISSSKEMKDMFMGMKKLRFVHLGSLDSQSEPFVGFLSSGCHAEAHYDFTEEYEAHNRIDSVKYPLESYAETIKMMEELKNKDKKEADKRADERYDKQVKKEQQKIEYREKKALEKVKKEESKEIKKEERKYTKQDIMKRVYEIKNKFDGEANSMGKDSMSWRELAKEVSKEIGRNIDHKSVKRYYEQKHNVEFNKDYNADGLNPT